MGFLYGLIFGILDIEDATKYKLAMLALKQESYSYPIGLILGMLSGIASEIMRQNGGDLKLAVEEAKFEQEI